MEPKEKAKELIDYFIPLVYSHVGSGFLTGDYDDDLILRNAKLCAHICVDEVILSDPVVFDLNNPRVPISNKTYWEKVKTEINKY